MMRKMIFAMIGLCVALSANAKTYEVSSPNGQLKITVENDKQGTTYAVAHGSTQVLNPSKIALTLSDGRVLGQEEAKYAKEQQTADFNALAVVFGKHAIEFRAYNGGVAYRFVTHFKEEVTVVDEQVEFVLPGDCMAYEALANSKGQFKNGTFNQQAYCSFENTYIYDNVSKLNRKHLGLSPMLVELAHGKKLLIGDYNVRNYPGMFLVPDNDNTLRGFFPQYPKKETQGGHHNLQMIIEQWEPFIAKCEGKRTYPWKMLLVSEKDADFLTTTIPASLADAPLFNGSWVKPGKVAWDWWNAWNLKGVDFVTGVNNDTYKYYIDFAANNGIEYVILDEGWAVNLKADLMQVVPEIDLPMLVKYAESKGVGIVLWAGYVAFDRDMDAVCKHYSEMGVKGFKIDFMDRCDQKVMQFLERAATTCAKYQLFCDFHGAPVPNGMTYTYPNVLNFEAVAGLEQVKWSKFDKFDEVRHETLLPFIRQVCGPMDYTQGAMRNATKKNYSACYTQPMSQGTRCRQLALYVIFNSPFNMLCDTPTNYEAETECLNYISKIPVVWDQREVLEAKVGECIVEACRKGDTWWIGGITNWDARDLTIDLSFLAGKKLKLYQDGLNADKHAEDYRLTTITVPADGKITIHLAPGGGFAAVSL